jgi:hypothetical protein
MDLILQALLSGHLILFILVPTIVICLVRFTAKKHPSLLFGCAQLLQSPSGVFGLLTLTAITVVTWVQPTVGGAAFAAFVAVVPAILAFCEHKETMAGIDGTLPPASPPPDPNAAKPVIGSPDAPVS